MSRFATFRIGCTSSQRSMQSADLSFNSPVFDSDIPVQHPQRSHCDPENVDCGDQCDLTID